MSVKPAPSWTSESRCPPPASYLEQAEAAQELVADGTLRLVSGTLPLEDLRPGRPLPNDGSDSLNHEFECTACGHRCRL